MSVITDVTISTCILFFIFPSIVITLLSRQDDPIRNDQILLMLMLAVLLLVSCITVDLSFLYPWKYSVFFSRLCVFLIVGLFPVIMTVVFRFLTQVLEQHGISTRRRWQYFLNGICAMHWLLLIYSQFTDFLYYFDSSNHFHAGYGASVSYLFCILELSYLALFILAHLQQLSHYELASLLSFILLPLIACVLELMYSVSLLTELFTAFCLFLFFIFQDMEKTLLLSRQQQLLKDQEKSLDNKVAEMARQAEELELQKENLTDQEKAIAFEKTVNEYYREQLRMKEQELMQANVQLSASQMRPHFIFNALGSIEQLCRTDPKRAAEATHQFATYLRTNLIAMNNCELISFSEELSHIKAYIWLEKMRFGEDISYEEVLEAEDFYVPFLSVQPLVENAIKHGMMGMEEGTLHVVLKTWEDEDSFYVMITDDGCGFDPKTLPADSKVHVGLINVRSHIEHMCKGQLVVDSSPGKGANFLIALPKKDNHI